VFSQGDTAIYASAGQNHTIKVAAVTNSTAVLTAGSANITLAQGESRNLDLDKDGTADLSVTLNGISNWAANLTFTMLAMAAPPAQGPSQNGTKTTNETGNEAENRPETAVPYGLIIAGVAAATAIAVLIKLPWLLKRLR
jgi:hypothetical protein